MPQFFSTLEDAVVWLVTNGWRQNEDTGTWLKGKQFADVRFSPANDGVVCVRLAAVRKGDF